MSITRKHYNVGYALYVAHQPLEACQNEAQKRGWWAALDADSACQIYGLLAKAAA